MRRRSIRNVVLIAISIGLLIALLQFLEDIYYLGYIELDLYAFLVTIPFMAGIFLLWWGIERKRKKRTDIRSVLTLREVEVYLRLLENKTNSEIADELFIEESTLKSHINRIYKKLDVRNRRALIQKASSVYSVP